MSDVRPTILLWYWGRRGGGARVTWQLAKALRAALGPEQVALAVASDNELLPDYRALGSPMTTTRPAWRGGLSLRARLSGLADLARFTAALRRSPCRTVVIAMNFPFAWPIVRFLGDRRIVYLCHDAAPHPGDFMRSWQRLSQARLIRAVDRIVALSDAVRDDILARYGPEVGPRIRVLPIQALYAGDGPIAPERGPGEPVRFLFAGRLLAYKGLDLLAEAAALLKERSGWTLTVAGEGPCEPAVRAAFAGRPNVDLRLGWLSERAYEAVIEQHDVVLCPYVEASQSGVLPDAAVRGVPGIVTPVGALAEQVGYGRAGLVAAAVTPQAFAAVMAQILDDRTLLARLRAGALEASGQGASRQVVDALLGA